MAVLLAPLPYKTGLFAAALAGLAVAARWKNTLMTIASGFATFWLLRWLA